jgi:diaminopimelate epimerase
VTEPLRTIPFVKASACGNDFLLIDGTLAPQNVVDFTRCVCDRHDGIGADGVEWMFAHFSADAEIRLMNADGSTAEISGNGTRCVAAYLCAERGKERISILTGAGIKVCALTGRRNSEYEFEIEMGDAEAGAELAVKAGTETFLGIPVSMGNPHYIVFVEEFSTNWRSQAAEIQRSPLFPHGVNVEFVIVDGKHEVRSLFYERGVGETRSSGTGSCASAVAAMATGRAQSPVKVKAPGGVQTVRKEGSRIFLRGPARLIGRGEVFVD